MTSGSLLNSVKRIAYILIYSLYKMTHTVNFIVFHGRIQAIQVAGTELK